VFLLLVAFLPFELVVFNVNANSLATNTGFEPWYHYIGEMVNSANGNLFLLAEDISVRGRGFNIKIVRSYNSFSSGIGGPFGYGWTFNYDMRLVENPDGTVTLYDGDGSAHVFASTEPGKYTPPPGVHLKLTKNPEETFTLRFKDGICWNFDSLGKPLNIVDKNGNQLTFTYDGQRLLMVADDSGLALIFDYDLANRVVRVLDPMGREITYEYDPAGNLFRVTDAMGYSTLYFYLGNLLEGVVNRFGGMLSFEYLDDKVVEIEAALYNYSSGLPNGSFTLYSMDYGDQNVTVTNARGFKTTVKMNGIGNPTSFIDALGGVTSMAWDADMNMVSLTNANGHTWNYTFDAYGNLLRERDPLGNSTLIGWNITDTETQYLSLIANITNGLGFTTSFAYDANGNIRSVEDAAGNSSYFSCDTYGNVIEFVDFRGYPTLYSYDFHGRLVNSTDAVGNSTLFSYDILGRLTSITDENGHSETFVYDSNDRLVRVIDPCGGETQYIYNEEGSLVSVVDPNGHQMNYSSNLINRVDRREYETGFGESYIYDRRGNVIKAIDANGAETLYSYDDLDRLVSVKNALGNTETYTYDPVGNLLSITDGNGNTTIFEYDRLNRRVRTADPLGNEARCEYDAIGQIISLEDANGYVTNYEYDPLNRLTRIIDASGNQTHFEYDANGNLIRFTDANNHASSFEYDPLNRILRAVRPNGSEKRFRYDAAGNNIEVVKPDGAVITFEYDAFDRLVSILYPDGSNITATYDLGGRVVEVANNGIGFGDVWHYSYDERRLVTSVRVDYGGIFDKTISYSYDPVGNRVMMNAEGEVTTYAYDLLGQLVSIQDPSGGVTTFEYDKVGRRTRASYPNGMQSIYTYDAVGNLLSLVNEKSIGDIVSSFTYSYDPVGNRLSVTRENGKVTSYEYDVLHRLTRTVYPDGTTVRYVYDAVGNRLQEIVNETYVTSYAYDANDRLLWKAKGPGEVTYYNFDPNGNLIAEEEGSDITSYKYDFEDRLTSVVLPSGLNTGYTYSPMGSRLSKTDASGTVFYLYDFEDILMELDVTGAPQASYTHGPCIDEPLSMLRGGNRFYYHFDGLGSIVALTDSSENILSTYEYDAFGEILEETGMLSNPYRFTGREYDEESGFYYYRARYYDPGTGRFTSIDPIRGCILPPQTINQYVYVMNNPTSFVDPDGRGFLKKLWKAVVTVYEFIVGAKKALDDGEAAQKKKVNELERIARGEAEDDDAVKAAQRQRAGAISDAAEAGVRANAAVARCSAREVPGLGTDPPPTKSKVGPPKAEAFCSNIPYLQVVEPGGEVVTDPTEEVSQSNPPTKDLEKLIKILTRPRIDDRFLRCLITVRIIPSYYAVPHKDMSFASSDVAIFPISSFDSYGMGTYKICMFLPMLTLNFDLLKSNGGPSIVSIVSHDIAVTDIAPARTVIGQGYSLSINATTKNQGTFTETFNITVYANTTIIATFTDVILTSENSATLSFTWDTAGFSKGNYAISAYATPVTGETDTADNRFVDGSVLVTRAGDFGTLSGGYYDFDDQCDYQDLWLFRKAYVEAYHPLCDFDNDQDVDYLDLFQFRKCYINP